jgi:O-succinylbenzoate synthase
MIPVPPLVEAIEVVSGEVPMRRPLQAAHGTEERRLVVFVRLCAKDAEGWGECAALSAPTYDDSWAAGERAVLVQHLAPALLAEPVPLAPGPLDARLEGRFRGHGPAKAALVTAGLDALGRSSGLDAATLLGGNARPVPTGASVGTGTDVSRLLEEADRLVRDGYRRLKVKIRPGFDVEPLRELREHLGDGVTLWADANGAYSTDESARLHRLCDLGLGLLEQPFPPGELMASARLSRELETPIAADEDVRHSRDVALLASLRAADVVVVKPSLLGGPEAARRAVELAQSHGLGCYIGGMLETSLGRAMAIALASHPGVELPGDLSAPGSYLSVDPALPCLPPIEDGHARGATGPGLGVTPRPELLEHVERHLLRRDA